LAVGAYVLVQRRGRKGEPPVAVIKRLAKRTDTKVVLEQFNPPSRFEIKATDIVSIHRVVGSAES
jgi:phage repressor protein C with HTH and peptisase S24 domain